MLDTLVFYSNCNKGDLHVSRELVRFVADAVPAKRKVYAHKWSPRILMDLPLEHTPRVAFNRDVPFHHDPRANLLALNTWYGVSPTFGNTYCSLNALVDLFKFHIERHGIRCELPSIEHLIPRIDYSKYHIAAAREFLQRSIWRKRVMVCDGPVLSGQTGGLLEDFRGAIEDVAIAHPDVLFLATERGGLRPHNNVVYTADIITLDDTDLCECSYVSTQCDVVIGRGSGPYTFAYVAENFLDPNKTMLCFTDRRDTAQWVYPESVVKARMLWSNGYGRDHVRAKIEEALS